MSSEIIFFLEFFFFFTLVYAQLAQKRASILRLVYLTSRLPADALTLVRPLPFRWRLKRNISKIKQEKPWIVKSRARPVAREEEKCETNTLYRGEQRLLSAIKLYQ